VEDDAPILRPAARVLVLDDHDHVLLLRANVGAGEVWITPRGALEPGETAEQAALRELREETGIESAELSPCVWTRVHRFEWGGKRHEQREQFFVARVEAPDICLDGCGPEELQFLTEWRWWTADEIAQSDAVFAPRTLAKILPAILDSQYPEQPIALPG